MANYTKKTWKNRQSDHPSRRLLTDISTGTEQVVDITRSEGTIQEEGDAFSATNMNDLENRVGEGFANSLGLRMLIPELVVAGVPEEDSEYQDWDKNEEYKYHLDVATEGTVEETDKAAFGAIDTNAECAPTATVMDDVIRFYFTSASEVNFKCYSVVVYYITVNS